jgi:hypothetical protein
VANTNLTLSIDENVLRQARKIALDRNTSVNEIVRDHLTELVKASIDPQERLRRLDELLANRKFELGPITWTRDDLHERR